MTLTLSAGQHVVELRGAGEPRTIPVTITAGTQATQYIELPKTAAKTGQLQIRTEPSGARVTVDGIPRGRSPITVVELMPGEHAVMLESEARRSVKESVIVESGVTASLVVPMSGARDTRARPAPFRLDFGHGAPGRADLRGRAPDRKQPERRDHGLGRPARHRDRQRGGRLSR